jgi:hypothetical protein
MLGIIIGIIAGITIGFATWNATIDRFNAVVNLRKKLRVKS